MLRVLCADAVAGHRSTTLILPVADHHTQQHIVIAIADSLHIEREQ